MSKPTQMTLDAAIDDLLSDTPRIEQFEILARQDHQRRLAHECAAALVDLVRLGDKLSERGGKLGPVDLHPWIDT